MAQDHHGFHEFKGQAGACSAIEPENLSRELLGVPQLVPCGGKEGGVRQRRQGNGFDAWRRVVVPIGPRSEAQLHRMHNDVHTPSASRRFNEVLGDLELW